MLVDADHGYGNALNVRRTVQELEAAGAAGLTIEDTLLPQAFGQTSAQLIPLEEGVGKIKAALDGRGDPSLVMTGRTGAASAPGIDDAIARAKAYQAVGVDGLFVTGIKDRARAGSDLGGDDAADRARRRARGNDRAGLSRPPSRADRVAGPCAVRRRNAGGVRDAKSIARENPRRRTSRAWRRRS